MPPCSHRELRFTSNEWVPDGYKQPSSEQISEALRAEEPPKKRQKAPTSLSAKTSVGISRGRISLPSEQTFPAPLVNEDDELYHDPEYPPQSLQEWIDEPARNPVTSKRRTIYVVPPPVVRDDVAFMRDWARPTIEKRKGATGDASRVPGVEDVAGYLRAFYHALPVKVFDDPILQLVPWDDGKTNKASQARMPSYVALGTGEEATRIRCRRCPDKLYDAQLNLNDILDVALSILPADAYAILMLTEHDLYEDEDDDFCCGRAFGGSRVAVVSLARYNPSLDARQGVDRLHSWPASHCVAVGPEPGMKSSRSKGTTALERYPRSPIAAGVDAFSATPRPTSGDDFSLVWLSRVCRTASHELGHCFGIDHCTYYACMMQGTASAAEDARQPPYLCPVDLAKVLRATGADEGERYGKLLKFCEQHTSERMFAAFAAWIGMSLQQVD